MHHCCHLFWVWSCWLLRRMHNITLPTIAIHTSVSRKSFWMPYFIYKQYVSNGIDRDVVVGMTRLKQWWIDIYLLWSTVWKVANCLAVIYHITSDLGWNVQQSRQPVSGVPLLKPTNSLTEYMHSHFPGDATIWWSLMWTGFMWAGHKQWL